MAAEDTTITSAPSTRRRSLRRGLLALGALSMLGAVALIAVLALDILGGETAPAVDASVNAARYRGDPGAIYDRQVTTPTPSPVPTATPVPAAAAATFRQSSFQIAIDRIGVNAPVYPYGLDSNGVPLVPLSGWEVAWYEWSATPGTGSNAVFAAHVTWSGPAVFYNLKSLDPGDAVRLVGADGTELTYTVQESFLVDPNDPNALSVMSPTDTDMITIITCDGDFYYTGDPVFRGDYTNRRIVRASLSTAIEAAPVGG